MTITPPPAALADVDAPADAETIYPWEQHDDSGVWSRCFFGTTHGDGAAGIIGFQNAAGAVARRVAIYIDEAVTPDAARDLAAALVAVADEVEQRSGDTDDAWADPGGQVDSTTRRCCGGVGSHTRECTVRAAVSDLSAAGL